MTTLDTWKCLLTEENANVVSQVCTKLTTTPRGWRCRRRRGRRTRRWGPVGSTSTATSTSMPASGCLWCWALSSCSWWTRSAAPTSTAAKVCFETGQPLLVWSYFLRTFPKRCLFTLDKTKCQSDTWPQCCWCLLQILSLEEMATLKSPPHWGLWSMQQVGGMLRRFLQRCKDMACCFLGWV